MTGLETAALARWRADPASFIETVLVNPGTGKPFELLPAERAFLVHAFKTSESGKLLYSEWLYSCPKKSGKTTFAALCTLTLLLLFGGQFAESTLAANDQEQARGRVFEACRRIIESSPFLKREAKVTQDRITFPAFGATITAIPASFSGAAGGNQNIAVFDEMWAYTSERSRRLWDELVPPPTRKMACRQSTKVRV
jgi:phage terminase large subunit-like protein